MQDETADCREAGEHSGHMMLTTATLAPSKLSAGDTTDAAAVSPPSHGSTSPAAAASGDTSIQPAPKACPGGVAASSTLQAANPSYHPPAASSEQPSSQSPAAGPHQQPSAPAGNQQQPPLTFDDLLPLLTSQQRTSSDNSDVLMDLFDAFARHGSGSFRPLARDSTGLSGALARLTSGLGSGLLASPLLMRGDSLARLESLGSQGAGSGAGLSPNLAALLMGSSDALRRNGSMESWMAWPPSPPQPPAADTNTMAHRRGPSTGQRESQSQKQQQQQQQPQAAAAAAGSSLEMTLSVNHWLSGSSSRPSMLAPPPGPPLPTGAAAGSTPAAFAGFAAASHPAAAARMPPYAYPTYPRAGPGPGGIGSSVPPHMPPPPQQLRRQDSLPVHQIHVGGEQLFQQQPTHPQHPYSDPFRGPFHPAQQMPPHAAAGMPPVDMGYSTGLTLPPAPPPEPFHALPADFHAAAAAAGYVPVASAEQARASARAARQLRRQQRREQRQAEAAGAAAPESDKAGGQRQEQEDHERSLAAGAGTAPALAHDLWGAPTPRGCLPGAAGGLPASHYTTPPAVPWTAGFNPYTWAPCVPPNNAAAAAAAGGPSSSSSGSDDDSSSDSDDADQGANAGVYAHDSMLAAAAAAAAAAAGAASGPEVQQTVARTDTAQSSNYPAAAVRLPPHFTSAQQQQQMMMGMWAQGGSYMPTGAVHAAGTYPGLQNMPAALNAVPGKGLRSHWLPTGPAAPHHQQQQVPGSGPAQGSFVDHMAPPAGNPLPVRVGVDAGGMQQQRGVAGGLVRHGSLAADRPRRNIRMTPAAVAAVAAVAGSDSEGSAAAASGKATGSTGRRGAGPKTKAAAAAPTATASGGTAPTKKRSRPRKAAAHTQSDSGSESVPDTGVSDGSSSDFSESEAVTRRRGRRPKTAVAAATAAASATSAGSAAAAAAGGKGKKKRAGGAAAGGRQGRGSRSTSAAQAAAAADGSETTKPVFEDTRSQYRGVTRHRRSGRWEAHIWIKELGRQVYLGGYDAEEAAAEAYDMAALKSKGPGCPTNFPAERYTEVLENMGGVTLEGLIMAVRRQSQGFSRGSSTYRGVTAHPSGRWESRIGIPGSKHCYLGLFQEEAAAAQAYDGALVRFKGAAAATNFSVALYQQQLAEHHQMKLACQAGLVDGDILAEQSGPEFELFIKSGVAAFDMQVTPAAWELARADTGAGTAGNSMPAADAAAAAAATAAAAAAAAAAAVVGS